MSHAKNCSLAYPLAQCGLEGSGADLFLPHPNDVSLEITIIMWSRKYSRYPCIIWWSSHEVPLLVQAHHWPSIAHLFLFLKLQMGCGVWDFQEGQLTQASGQCILPCTYSTFFKSIYLDRSVGTYGKKIKFIVSSSRDSLCIYLDL